MNDWVKGGGLFGITNSRIVAPDAAHEPQLPDDSHEKYVDMYSVEMCRWKVQGLKRRMSECRCIESDFFSFLKEDWTLCLHIRGHPVQRLYAYLKKRSHAGTSSSDEIDYGINLHNDGHPKKLISRTARANQNRDVFRFENIIDVDYLMNDGGFVTSEGSITFTVMALIPPSVARQKRIVDRFPKPAVVGVCDPVKKETKKAKRGEKREGVKYKSKLMEGMEEVNVLKPATQPQMEVGEETKEKTATNVAVQSCRLDKDHNDEFQKKMQPEGVDDAPQPDDVVLSPLIFFTETTSISIKEPLAHDPIASHPFVSPESNTACVDSKLSASSADGEKREGVKCKSKLMEGMEGVNVTKPATQPRMEVGEETKEEEEEEGGLAAIEFGKNTPDLSSVPPLAGAPALADPIKNERAAVGGGWAPMAAGGYWKLSAATVAARGGDWTSTPEAEAPALGGWESAGAPTAGEG